MNFVHTALVQKISSKMYPQGTFLLARAERVGDAIKRTPSKRCWDILKVWSFIVVKAKSIG